MQLVWEVRIRDGARDLVPFQGIGDPGCGHDSIEMCSGGVAKRFCDRRRVDDAFRIVVAFSGSTPLTCGPSVPEQLIEEGRLDQ
jgi:hypothetical protein